MKTRYLFAVVAITGAVLWTVGPAGAEDSEKMDKPEVSAEFEAQMAEWLKYANPSEHHKHLEELAGTWDTKVKFWQAPGAQPMESTGTARHAMVLGGRFLGTSYQGEFMEKPFEGMGFSGYDNYLKKHTDIWMDTMGTLMFGSHGTCTDEGKVLRMTGEYADPATGTKKSAKSITRFLNEHQYVLEFYEKGPDGREFKSMEILHTRRGS